jgi:hypothetical protein
MNGQRKKYQTQWASQFFAAAELTRRGYQVALTLGNAPVTDLLVVSPEGKYFQVDVKGQSTRSFWLIQNRTIEENLFFIMVYLPKDNLPPQYCLLSCSQIMAERDTYRQHVEQIGTKYRDDLGGMNWSVAFRYKDNWDILPK